MSGDDTEDLKNNSESLSDEIYPEQVIELSRKEGLRLLISTCQADMFNICNVDKVKSLIELIASKIPNSDVRSDKDVDHFLRVYHCEKYEKIPGDILKLFPKMIFQYLGISGNKGSVIFGEQWPQCENSIKDRFVEQNIDLDTSTILRQIKKDREPLFCLNVVISFAVGFIAALAIYGIFNVAFGGKAVSHHDYRKIQFPRAYYGGDCAPEWLVCLKMKSSNPEKTVSNVLSGLSFDTDGEYEINLSIKRIYNVQPILESSQIGISPVQPEYVEHK